MDNISRASDDEHTTALSLLFQSTPPAERAAQIEEMLAAAGRGEFSLDGLLVARDGSQVRGAVMSVAQEDGTAFLWTAQVVSDTDADQIADQLYGEVIRQVDEAGLISTQAIVEVDATSERAALDRNGFLHLANLYYLQCLLTTPLPALAKVEFEVTTFSPAQNEQRFAALVEQTYIETLDCPGFQVNRNGVEALTSHQCSGEFSAERWKAYAVDGVDVGVLLLNDHPAQDAWEVVYMGVTPEARGRGYGRAMLIDGMHAARAAGRQSVLLAVDANNAPANRIYRDLGFHEVASRAVHLRTGIKGDTVD